MNTTLARTARGKLDLAPLWRWSKSDPGVTGFRKSASCAFVVNFSAELGTPRPGGTRTREKRGFPAKSASYLDQNSAALLALSRASFFLESADYEQKWTAADRYRSFPRRNIDPGVYCLAVLEWPRWDPYFVSLSPHDWITAISVVYPRQCPRGRYCWAQLQKQRKLWP